jgi:predicted DsbA family dithiol-disulfide isomerase
MTVNIKVFSDYICPYCFLAEFPLAAAIQDKDVEVEWLPFELRPAPQPTLKPEDNYLQTVWRQSVYPLARKMDVEIKLPSISPQPYTHLAFEGYQYAKEHGLANQYNDRVLRAFFQEDQDIGQIDVLTKLAEAIGLNAAEFKAVLETRKYRTVHQQALEYATEQIGINSVPTFMIGDRIFPGLLSKETLEQAISAAMEGEQDESESVARLR